MHDSYYPCYLCNDAWKDNKSFIVILLKQLRGVPSTIMLKGNISHTSPRHASNCLSFSFLSCELNTHHIYYIFTRVIETYLTRSRVRDIYLTLFIRHFARRHLFILSCLPTMHQQTDVPINPKRETRSLIQEVADTLETASLCIPTHNLQQPMQLLQQQEFTH